MNEQTRSEEMRIDEKEEKVIRVETLEECDRELARDGGETLEVPAWMESRSAPLPSPRPPAAAGTARPLFRVPQSQTLTATSITSAREPLTATRSGLISGRNRNGNDTDTLA